MKKSIYTEAHENTIRRMKQARIDSELTQAKAAGLLGRTQSYISKIESGQCRVDIALMQELAKIYGKSISYFIRG